MMERFSALMFLFFLFRKSCTHGFRFLRNDGPQFHDEYSPFPFSSNPPPPKKKKKKKEEERKKNVSPQRLFI